MNMNAYAMNMNIQNMMYYSPQPTSNHSPQGTNIMIKPEGVFYPAVINPATTPHAYSPMCTPFATFPTTNPQTTVMPIYYASTNSVQSNNAVPSLQSPTAQLFDQNRNCW
eukprot:UN28305